MAVTPRDGQLYKRVGALLRFFGGHTEGGTAQPDPVSNRSLLQSPGWAPFAPAMPGAGQDHTFASTFPAADRSDETLITIVTFDPVTAATFTVDGSFGTGYVCPGWPFPARAMQMCVYDVCIWVPCFTAPSETVQIPRTA